MINYKYVLLLYYKCSDRIELSKILIVSLIFRIYIEYFEFVKIHQNLWNSGENKNQYRLGQSNK